LAAQHLRAVFFSFFSGTPILSAENSVSRMKFGTASFAMSIGILICSETSRLSKRDFLLRFTALSIHKIRDVIKPNVALVIEERLAGP
jgi:hypothetical protein